MKKEYYLWRAYVSKATKIKKKSPLDESGQVAKLYQDQFQTL